MDGGGATKTSRGIVAVGNNGRTVFQRGITHGECTVAKVSRSWIASARRHPAVRSALSSRPPRQQEARLHGPPIYYYPESLMVNCDSPPFPPRACPRSARAAEGKRGGSSCLAASPDESRINREISNGLLAIRSRPAPCDGAEMVINYPPPRNANARLHATSSSPTAIPPSPTPGWLASHETARRYVIAGIQFHGCVDPARRLATFRLFPDSSLVLPANRRHS